MSKKLHIILLTLLGMINLIAMIYWHDMISEVSHAAVMLTAFYLAHRRAMFRD